jgi:hypothetical protein
MRSRIEPYAAPQRRDMTMDIDQAIAEAINLSKRS